MNLSPNCWGEKSWVNSCVYGIHKRFYTITNLERHPKITHMCLYPIKPLSRTKK